MRKLIAILAVVLAMPTMSFAGGEGRYQAYVLYQGTGNYARFLILDTKTGKMKMCDVNNLSKDEKIECGKEQNGN